MRILLALLLLLVAAPAHAVLYWDEDFEYTSLAAYTAVWPATCANPYSSATYSLSTTRSHSGVKALKETFTGQDVGGNCATDRNYTPTPTIYHRWWMYMDNLVVSPVSTKIFAENTVGGGGQQYPNGWWAMISGSKNLTFTTQNAGNGMSTFNTTGGTIPSNQWVCVETGIFMGSPGQANGFIKAWINGTQVINQNSIAFLPTSSNGTQGNDQKGKGIQLYRQNAQSGSIYYDQFASGTTQIGCGGGAPPGNDITAPTVPTNLAGTATTGSAASLTWTESTDPGSPTTGVNGYPLERCTGSGCTNFTALTTVTAPAAAYVDNTLTASTIYRYRIGAVDGAAPPNASAMSSAITVTTPAVFRVTTITKSWAATPDGADLGADWDAGYTGMQAAKIVSQRVLPVLLNTDSFESFNVTTPANDQWCMVTVGALTGAVQAEVGCALRMADPPTRSLYLCYASRNGGISSEIVEGDSPSLATLVSENTTTWAAGDKLRCEAQGTTIRLFRIPFGTTQDIELLTTTDASRTSGKVGIGAVVLTGGALTAAQLYEFAAGEWNTSVASGITFDAVSDSAVNTSSASVSWSHTYAGSNRLALVCAQARSTVQANVAVTGVTVGGIAATKIHHSERATGTEYLRTEQWYLLNPTAGAQTTAITWVGAPSSYAVGTTVSFSGVDQTAPIDAAEVNFGSDTAVQVAVSTVADNAWLADCAMTKQNSGLVIGAGQTTRTNRVISGSLDGMGVSTVDGKTPAGAETMDWTTTPADNFAISAVSLKPASGTAPPVVEPTIASLVLSGTGATLTYGATTPTQIRVDAGNGVQGYLSVLEPISAFPGGVYTRAWSDGLTYACFHPLNSVGVENTAVNAFQCGDLTPFVDPLDVTPPTLSNCKPSGDLPFGTTSTVLSCDLDKPAICRYDTTDQAYALMPVDSMTTASLTCSATLSGLTNGSTSIKFARGMSTDALLGEHPTTSSQSVTVHVLGSAGADTTPPSTVAGLAAALAPTTPYQATLVWGAATDNVLVSGYQVYQSDGACTVYVAAGNPVTATTVQFNLQPLTTYCWTVKAIDSSNNPSAAMSNIVTVTTGPVVDVQPPSTPGALSAAPIGSDSLLITVPPGTDNTFIAFTSLERCAGIGCSNFAVIATVGVGVTGIVDSGLTSSTTYTYRAKFIDSAGNPSVAYSPLLQTQTNPVSGATSGYCRCHLPH